MNEIPDDDNARTGRRKYLPAGVFLVTLTITVALSLIYHDFLTARARERFDARADLVTAALQDRLNDYDMVLRGGAALFATTDEVSRAAWRSYIGRLDIEHSYPGIQGIGFSRRIEPADLPRHVREVRAEGFPEYVVWPGGAREEYTSIVYLEPFDARNRRAFGYDMFSENVRRGAMERARDSGRTAISGKVKLVQETEEDVQPGFLMYLPVSRAQASSPASSVPLEGARKSLFAPLAAHHAGRGQDEGSPETVEERRRSLAGYVYAPFRMRNFVEGIVSGAAADIDLEIYDGAAAAESALLYDSGGCRTTRTAGERPFFSKERLLDLYGHQWKIVFMSLPAFEAAAGARHQLWGPLAAGILISLLVFLFIREQEGTRGRALTLATRMTDELRRSHEVLEERVRERTTELEAARTQAETATRAKSEFLANMSHELRTPLNSILGFSEVLRDGLAGEMNPQQKEYLNDVWESGSHLLRLINDILDISKIEAGKMELEPGEVDLCRLLKETLVLYREKAARHRISLHTEVADDVPPVRADERKTKQVLINLLTNALKFTPDDGEVGVCSIREGCEVHVSVWDTGIGIAAEDQKGLFQPFQQLESALTKKYEGTGLGLHLCRKIVELHGGRIWVESTPGQGSRFTFAIPIAPAAGGQA